ncbi:MAG: MOSC domain-containing protein, partial [Candidatus Melainabacteria bacterium HGW-Melainabacteria-1]
KLNFGWGSEQLQLALPPYQLPHIEVQIWRSKVMAQLFDVGVNAWFSRALMRECRLVYLPDSSFRGTNPDVAPGQRVSFADGYPYLLCNQGSLDDLNQHLRAKGCPTVGIERFRPNLVVSGAKAFAEDNWKQIQIGDIGFELVKPCERCVIISTDQHSGIVGSEPLQTLATYRRQAGKVIFGQNLVARLDCGQVKIADPVRV